MASRDTSMPRPGRHADVRLRNVHRATREQFAEAELGEFVFAAGDRRDEGAAHLGLTVKVFLHHRFVVPA